MPKTQDNNHLASIDPELVEGRNREKREGLIETVENWDQQGRE